MTSTSFNVGLSDDARLSSRVLRPPGGGHTNIFGGEPDPPRIGRCRASEANDLCNVANPAPEKPTEAANQNGDANTEAPAPVSAQEPANNNEAEKLKAKPELPITESAKTEPPKLVVEPPKRVRVPPGGFSSGLW